MNAKQNRFGNPWLAALLALVLLPSTQALAAGSDHGGVPFISVPAPAAMPDTGAATVPVPGGPGQGDVTNPSYLNPAPQSLSSSQQLQLKAYRNQLNQQQQDLQIQQAHGLLTPNQQQRLYQTQQEIEQSQSDAHPAFGPGLHHALALPQRRSAAPHPLRQRPHSRPAASKSLQIVVPNQFFPGCRWA